MVAAKPVNEAGRIAALDRYAILDSDPEQLFDDLTMLASFVCNTPSPLSHSSTKTANGSNPV